MKRLVFRCLILFLLPGVQFGCVDLKAVNDYATSSQKVIKEYNELGISVKSSHLALEAEDCLRKDLSKALPEDVFKECHDEADIKRYQKADSLVSVLNTVLAGYFKGLEDISKNEATSFELKGDLLKELLEDDDEFNIKDEHIAAATRIVTLLTRASSDILRANRLKALIDDADDDISTFIDLSVQIATDMVDILDTDLQSHYQNYQDDFLKASNYFEKIAASKSYTDRYYAIKKKIKAVEDYKEALDKMKEGHNKLAENSSVKTKDIMDVIATYTTQIIEIKNELVKANEDE